MLKSRLAQEDFSALGEIRKTVLNLNASTQLVRFLCIFRRFSFIFVFLITRSLISCNFVLFHL
jgi:hypothetical protein